jgi:hypothetical protein
VISQVLDNCNAGRVAHPTLIDAAKAEQESRYQSDAWDALIERWLVFEKRRENRGVGAFDDWREVEIKRPKPIRDVSVGYILEHALGIEPSRWTKSDQTRVGAYLKAKNWQRYQRRGAGAVREWRYRLVQLDGEEA